MYRDIVSEHDWGFPAEPPAEVMKILAGLPPRDMKKRLMTAFGTAKLDGRSELKAADLDLPRGKGAPRRIGF
jgi:ATP-dependent Lon protease